MSLIRIFPSMEMAEKHLPDRALKKIVYRNQSYCAVRMGEQILVFSDLCPHERASLSQGKITGYDEIVCPLHSYRFNLKLGDESSLRCPGLEFIPVKVMEEGVFIDI